MHTVLYQVPYTDILVAGGNGFIKKKLISLPNVQGLDTIEYAVMYTVLVIALYIKTDTLFQTCKKTIFFTQTWFEPKIFYQKKCVNYDKSNLRQNSVKGQKDPNSVFKNAKK